MVGGSPFYHGARVPPSQHIIGNRSQNATTGHRFRNGHSSPHKEGQVTIAGSIGVKLVCGRPVTVYRLQTDTEWRVSPTPPNNPNLRGRGDAATPPETSLTGSGFVRVKATQGYGE